MLLTSMQLSIVTTLYGSEGFLSEFYDRAKQAAAKITGDYEIVLVNDGSPDKSLEIARSLADADERVTVVDLSRNFGHHKAIMTGLAYARGELVFLLDSDLEEDPGLLQLFHRQLGVHQADVVYGVQAKRRGSSWDRLSGYLFYELFNLLSAQPLPRNLITARLMTKRYVRSLLQYAEAEIVVSGIWVLTGYKQVAIPVTKQDRGAASYSLPQRVWMLVDSITSFSSRPLSLIFYLGLVVVLIAGGYAIVLVTRRLLFGEIPEGWTSLIVSVWLLGGLVLFCLGIVGIYLSKIFLEVKRRPRTIVRDVYRQPGNTLDERSNNSETSRAVLHLED